MEIGSVAEVVAAVGGLAATVVSILALVTAVAANRTAENTRREAKAYADETIAREKLRQHTEVARQLQAWWVVWHGEKGKRFGILVTNAGEGATVFRNVRIETQGNVNVKGSRGDIAFTSLPPGSYVIPSNAAGAEQPWGDLELATPEVKYEPLVKARNYVVTRITFEDPVKSQWTWTPEDGLGSATMTA